VWRPEPTREAACGYEVWLYSPPATTLAGRLQRRFAASRPGRSTMLTVCRVFLLFAIVLTLAAGEPAAAAQAATFALPPRSPAAASKAGTSPLTVRSCAAKGDTHERAPRAAPWDTKQTAVIVCDMWDTHHCLNAVRRVEELAPRMNQVLEKARSQGALIIHAPSSCMEPYKDHPGRKRVQAAPKAANLPKDIHQWCNQIPEETKGKYPLDQSDGGCDSDPAEQKAFAQKLEEMGRNPKAPWKRQTDVLKIHDEDAISDSGVEIWNLLEQRGI